MTEADYIQEQVFLEKSIAEGHAYDKIQSMDANQTIKDILEIGPKLDQLFATQKLPAYTIAKRLHDNQSQPTAAQLKAVRQILKIYYKDHYIQHPPKS